MLLRGACPTCTAIPSSRRRSISGEGVESDPATVRPRCFSKRARALMPAPPMPTRKKLVFPSRASRGAKAVAISSGLRISGVVGGHSNEIYDSVGGVRNIPLG